MNNRFNISVCFKRTKPLTADHFALLLAMLVCLGGVGCASTPYRYGSRVRLNEDVTIATGRPHPGLDRLAWVAGLPSRILPLHSGVNNHSLSSETSDKLTTYLQDNQLCDVYVRVNQYDPIGEWGRLKENDRIAPSWRYTVGAVGVLGYTIFPGRVFGGDLYNPFTNGLYINSDVPAVVLAEAAYAKDIHSQRFPGPYATMSEVPVLALWRHFKAVNDVLGYARAEQDWELEREVYRVVYPQLGVHAAGGGHTAATLFTTMPLYGIPLVALGGACVGHVAGQACIAQRSRMLRAHDDSPEE